VLQVRVFGRREPAGGGEFLAAATLLARAAVRTGLHVQLRPPWAFPRGGVAEHATLRIGREPILDASQDCDLDLVAVADASVLGEANVLDRIKPEGIVLFALDQPPNLPNFSGKVVAAGLDRMSAALGVPLRFPLAAAIGSLLDLLPPDALEEVALREVAGPKQEKAREAIRRAADEVTRPRVDNA